MARESWEVDLDRHLDWLDELERRHDEMLDIWQEFDMTKYDEKVNEFHPSLSEHLNNFIDDRLRLADYGETSVGEETIRYAIIEWLESDDLTEKMQSIYGDEIWDDDDFVKKFENLDSELSKMADINYNPFTAGYEDVGESLKEMRDFDLGKWVASGRDERDF